MAKQLQLRRGTTSQHSTFTGANGEVTIDTDKKVLVVHDGATAGGIPLAKQATVDTKVDKITSTDNAIVRFNGTTGDVQNSGVIIDELNNISVLDGSDNSASIKSTDIAIVSSDPSWLGSGAGVRVNRTWSNVSNLDFLVSSGAARYSAMRIDSAGNVGIGVTPSAWTTYKSLELGAGNGIHASNGLGQELHISNNAYYNSGYKYALSYYATDYTQTDGKHVWRTAPSGTSGNTIAWTNAMNLDASGNLLLQSGTGGIGYGTGAGGTVTQLTSKSTSVTLNKPSGTIIMNNAALAAGSSISFTLNNNLINRQCSFGFTPNDNANYSVTPMYSSTGYVGINVKNNSGSSLSEALQFSFTIIKGATA